MNIQEQIEDARRWADDERKCGDGARAVSIDGYADTMEKMLTALEDIAKQELIIEMEHEGDIEYGYDAIIEVARAAVLEEREQK